MGRAVLWNVCVGVVCALIALAVLVGIAAVEGGEDEAVAWLGAGLILAPMMGAALGAAAGVVHGVVQLPLAAWGPRRGRLLTRVLATAVSVTLVIVYIDIQTDDDAPIPLLAVVPFAAYVLVTPWLAGRRYDARADAALSAARRSGASSVSRVSGSDSDSSRATSE